MPAYAVGIVPLLSMISLGKSAREDEQTYQVAYADDLARGGKISNLRTWWDKLLECLTNKEVLSFKQGSNTSLF